MFKQYSRPPQFLLLFAVSTATVLAQPQVSVAPSLTRVSQNAPLGSGTTAQISAARGEYESFQIIVHSPSGGLSNVNVSVSDLSGPGGAIIPRSSFLLFREYYVNVTSSSPNWGGSNQPLGAGTYPDGLVPFVDPATGSAPVGGSIAAAPFNVGGNANQPVWVDLQVPRGIPGGVYNGSYTVTSSQGSTGGGITVTVWNFDMPVIPSLKSSFLFWNGEGVAAQQELLRNRIMPLHPDVATQSTLVNTFGLGASGLPFWSGADVSTCSMSGAPSASQFSSSASQQQPGIMKYDYSADEIGSCSSLYSTVKQWAFNMHQAGVKNLITMSPDPNLYDDGSGTGRSAVDIWVMLPVMYDGSSSNVNYVIGKGDQAWSYNALVQDSYSPKWLIDFAPINFRIQPGFISQSLNLTGMLYWKVDDWSSDPWNQVNNPGKFSSANYPGEGMLVYPGNYAGIQGVAPSMRLKWLRDGVDDYEYVNILKGLGQGAWAMQLAQSVGANWSNWTRDPNALESVRSQLGAKIDSLNGGSAGTGGGTSGGTGGGTGGGSTSAPAAPVNPNPASGTSGASTTPTLSWPAVSGATSYDYYFGTTSTPNRIGNTTGTNFAPGTLNPNSTYYWAVVAKNTAGDASSTIWSFTTAAAVQGSAPAAPANPNPGNGATGMSTTPTISWPAVSGATSYDYYFGTTSTPNLIGNTTGTSFSPGALNYSSTYYWAVVAKNSYGSASSQIWSFTTTGMSVTTQVPPLTPTPSNGTTGVSVTPTLSWTNQNAISYTVYFGTSSNPPSAGITSNLSYTPGTLAAGTTYYWRLVVRTGNGEVSSPLWYFTTASQAPPSNVAPVDVSVTPNSGAGNMTTFTLVYSDTNGASDIAGAGGLINSSFTGVNGCWFFYNRANSTIALATNDTSSWNVVPMSGGVISNNQCTLRNATAVANGNTITLKLTINFTRGFSGAKNLYMYSQDNGGLDSGYPLMGTWVVKK